MPPASSTWPLPVRRPEVTSIRGATRWPLLGAVAGVVGCTPALDWRDFRPEGARSVVALFPCKPDGHALELALAGVKTRLTLHACRAEGMTWGLAWADVGDPSGVGPALDALREAFQRNLGATSARPQDGWRVAGATPQSAAGRWSVQGRFPDGGALHGEVVVFAHGTRVIQATVLSDGTRAQDVATFMDALRVVP